MIELDEKLRQLIKWVQDTYGCSKKEAISSINHKLNEIL